MWPTDLSRRAFRDTGLSTSPSSFSSSDNLFRPFLASFVLRKLFSDCFLVVNFPFLCYEEHFHRKQNRDPAFLSCPRRPCLSRMLSRAILRDFFAGNFLACTLGTILRAAKKPFRASLKDIFLSEQLLFSSSIRMLTVFDLVPWVGDLRRASMNSAHLASLQFLEFVDIFESEVKVWDMIISQVCFCFRRTSVFLFSVSTLSTRNAFNLWPKKEGLL